MITKRVEDKAIYLSKAGDYGHACKDVGSFFGRIESTSVEAFVIIPTYNEESNIGMLLSSLHAQSISSSKFVVIVVDNNSKDTTQTIVKEYIYTKNIANVILAEELEQGVSSTRKRGFDLACYLSTLKFDIISDEVILLSLDADTTYLPEDWIERYINKFASDQKYDLLVGNANFDISLLKDKPNLLKFMRQKAELDAFAHELFTDKAEGCDMGVKLDMYIKIGGIKPLYYLYKGIVYQAASDDWNLSLEIMEKGGIIGFCDSKLFTSARKFINSIDTVISGSLYSKNWRDLNTIDVNKVIEDINEEQLQFLMEKQVRGIVTYRMFMNIFVNPDLIAKNAEFLQSGGIDIDKFSEDVAFFKQQFPKVPLSDLLSYFVPARVLYYYYGWELMQALKLKFDYVPKYYLIRPFMRVQQSDSLSDNVKSFQHLIEICSSFAIEDYFAEF